MHIDFWKKITWDYFRYLAGQSPWCSGPAHPPLCACRRAHCRSRLAACWAGGWVGCARGRALCEGGVSGPVRETWGPSEPGPAAGPAAGGAGELAGRAGTRWLWVGPALGRGWPAVCRLDSRIVGSFRGPQVSVGSFRGGRWSACPAHLLEKQKPVDS